MQNRDNFLRLCSFHPERVEIRFTKITQMFASKKFKPGRQGAQMGKHLNSRAAGA